MNMKSLWAGVFLTLSAVSTQAQNTGLDARVDLRVEQRPLGRVVENLRARTGANIVITDGLESGDSVAVAGAAHLREGMKVRPMGQ